MPLHFLDVSGLDLLLKMVRFWSLGFRMPMVNQQKKVAIGCEGGRFEIRKKNGWGLGKPMERRFFLRIGKGDGIISKKFFAR
jgi:hypothetical protein